MPTKNQYGLPFVAPIRQTILPAMTQDGIVVGWYPITATTFSGNETTFTIPDGTNGGAGFAVPLKTVTQYSGIGMPQYMAAVWPSGLAKNYFPWASNLLQKVDAGYSRWYSMPTESWFEHFTPGSLIAGLGGGTLNLTVSAATNPSAPTVSTPATYTWQASVLYATLNGECPFLDFNWVTLFNAKSATKGVRIVTTTQPAGSPPALVSSVVGIPTATADGVMYNGIRIMKLNDLEPGSFAFGFTVYDELGQTSNVVLNLTVQ